MNMFAKAWKVPAKTSTPIESHQVMGKEVPQSIVHKFEHSVAMAPITTFEPTVTPEPIQETSVGTDIDVAATGPV